MSAKTKQISDNISTVCGVDALYYHLKINFQHYTQFYNTCFLNNTSQMGCFTRTSENWLRQYAFFELKCPNDNITIARIGFKNLNTRDNLDSIMVQMDTFYMNTKGVLQSYYDVVEHIEGLGLQVGRSKVSRIDLNTYVYGYDFSYLEYFYFSTLIRSNTKIYNGAKDKLETIYLGSRTSGAPYMRIYNKWAELMAKDEDQKKQSLIRYKFLKQYDMHLDMDKPLWNVEFELKREFLKSYSIDTVEQCLQSVNVLHSELMKRIRLMTKKRKEEDKNADRIPTAPIWEMIGTNYNFQDSNVPLDKLPAIKYVKSLDWALNRFDEYLASNSDNLTDNQILLAFADRLKARTRNQNEETKEKRRELSDSILGHYELSDTL
jgi:hypothetical protein